MSLGERSVNGTVILTPSGMLLGGKETDELMNRVKELDDAKNERLLIDLSKTTYMSSMGLAAIIRARVSYTKRGARVKLCSMDKKITQLFVLVKLPLVFGDDVHETAEQALESFGAVDSVPTG